MKKLAIMALATAVVSSAWAVQGMLTKKDGGTVKGDITITRKGDYSIKQGNASVEVAAADVVKVSVPQPKDYKAILESRDDAKLQKIVTDYRKLGWDLEAGNVLVQVLLERKDVNRAYAVAKKLIDDGGKDKHLDYTGAIAPAYWRTLLAKGDRTTLEKLLNKAKSSGDDYAYVWSLILRGDILHETAQNEEGAQKAKTLRQALTDGYLRAALLYREHSDDGCRLASRQAMERCSVVFEELGNNVYAEFLKSEAAK